jgi:hypothetical protein
MVGTDLSSASWSATLGDAFAIVSSSSAKVPGLTGRGNGASVTIGSGVNLSDDGGNTRGKAITPALSDARIARHEAEHIKVIAAVSARQRVHLHLGTLMPAANLRLGS